MTYDDTMTRLGYDEGDSFSGSQFYSGAIKGCFYMHTSTFSILILNSAYTHSGFYVCATTERSRL
jgi:hypothetical protein